MNPFRYHELLHSHTSFHLFEFSCLRFSSFFPHRKDTRDTHCFVLMIVCRIVGLSTGGVTMQAAIFLLFAHCLSIVGGTSLHQSSEPASQLQVRVQSQNSQSIVFSVAPSQDAVICLFFSAETIPSSLSHEASAPVDTCINATAHAFTSVSCLANQIDGSEHAYFAGYSRAYHLQMDFPIVQVHYSSVFQNSRQPRSVIDLRDGGRHLVRVNRSVL